MGDSYRILKIKDRLNWEEIPVLDVDKVLWLEDAGNTELSQAAGFSES